jgi:hypothetical protein
MPSRGRIAVSYASNNTELGRSSSHTYPCRFPLITTIGQQHLASPSWVPLPATNSLPFMMNPPHMPPLTNPQPLPLSQSAPQGHGSVEGDEKPIMLLTLEVLRRARSDLLHLGRDMGDPQVGFPNTAPTPVNTAPEWLWVRLNCTSSWFFF